MRIYRRGFTFIELLVVVSIIGLLSTVVLSGAAATRKSARVAQRVGDLKRVQNSLDLYYSTHRAYPSTGGTSSWRSTCSSWGGYALHDVIPGLVPAYLTTMPNDPHTASGSNNNCYLYTSNGTDYAFLDHAVTELGDGSPGATYAKYPELIDPARDGGSNSSLVDGSGIWSWKVSSPGAISW